MEIRSSKAMTPVVLMSSAQGERGLGWSSSSGLFSRSVILSGHTPRGSRWNGGLGGSRPEEEGDLGDGPLVDTSRGLDLYYPDQAI